jgi:diacylglycerol kinase (ATP)
MEITLVGDLPLSQILEAFPILLRDGRLDWPEVTRLRARRISIRADRRAWFHGDGELLGEIPVEIEVLPSALQVIAPPSPE